MHEYNPLQLPEIISNIVSNLSLEDLNKICWINHTWYKEVRQELQKRCETLQKKRKKIDKYQSFKTEVHKEKALLVVSREIIEIVYCALLNGMFSGKEKEDVEYIIKKSMAKEIRQELRKR